MRNYQRQTRRMKETEEVSLDNDRSMFENMSGDPRLSRFSSGQAIGTSVLTIVDSFFVPADELVLSSFPGDGFADVYEVKHNLKKAYEVFGRLRLSNGSYKMLPTINELGGTIGSIRYLDIWNVDEEKVYITKTFSESFQEGVELFFIDFTI